MHSSPIIHLGELIGAAGRLIVLTGAGCSTGSGIPDYRNEAGDWKRDQPVRFREFTTDPRARRRYWARSYVGWSGFRAARPNPAHVALAGLEARGRLHHLVTQNVDGLHQAAGSRRVVDLHGRLDRVVCLDCRGSLSRDALQARLVSLNPDWTPPESAIAPDGDADLDPAATERFRYPDCPVCGGVLKPDVVFFGENVPPDRVERCAELVAGCDTLLVVGSSLMVRSGFRLVEAAAARGVPIAIVNRGVTRADHLAVIKIEADCGETLSRLSVPARS